MSIWKYIGDRKYLIFFYILLMIFVSSVAYLDRLGGISFENIVYLNVVSDIFFSIYIVLEYIQKREYYNQIGDIIKDNQGDIINAIPEPRTHEEKLFNDLLKSMHNSQRNKIEKLYEDKRENQEFITTWVHEVKTPISVIRLLLEKDDGTRDDSVFSSIEEEIDKIEGEVEQALYYSRTDDFSKDYFINEIELEKVIREAIKRNARVFINKKIKVSMDEINLTVLTDKKWLLFIINQILSNSLKYTASGGRIHIGSLEDGMEKRMIIEDNGIGIKSEDLSRVFSRGFTGHTGRQYSKSTGMGLYLSKRLAGKLGHDISIESEEGKYTRVIIHFPKLNNYLNVTKM